jgi:hypothetical protein
MSPSDSGRRSILFFWIASTLSDDRLEISSGILLIRLRLKSKISKEDNCRIYIEVLSFLQPIPIQIQSYRCGKVSQRIISRVEIA